MKGIHPIEGLTYFFSDAVVIIDQHGHIGTKYAIFFLISSNVSLFRVDPAN